MQNKKIKAVIAILLLLTVAAGAIWYFAFKPDQDYVREGVNYSPPTQADKTYNDSIKENLADQKPDANGTEDPADRKTVSPIISSWGQPAGPGGELKVNGYVPSIIETNGTCTIYLTNGDTKVSTSKAALQNAQGTSCGQMTFDSSKVNPGTWDAVLSYESPTSIGTSEPVKVEVR